MATTYVTGSDFNGTSKQPVKIVDAGLFVIGAFGNKKVSHDPLRPADGQRVEHSVRERVFGSLRDRQR